MQEKKIRASTRTHTYEILFYLKKKNLLISICWHQFTSTSNVRSLSSRKITRSRSFVSLETRDMLVMLASPRFRRCCSSMSASPSGRTGVHQLHHPGRQSARRSLRFTRSSSSSSPSSSSSSSPLVRTSAAAPGVRADGTLTFPVWPLIVQRLYHNIQYCAVLQLRW